MKTLFVTLVLLIPLSAAHGRSDVHEIRSDSTDEVSFSLRVEYREFKGQRSFVFLVPRESKLSGYLRYSRDEQSLLETPVEKKSHDGYTAWRFSVGSELLDEVVFSLGVLHMAGSMSAWGFYLGDLLEAPFERVENADYESQVPTLSSGYNRRGEYWKLELGPARSWAPN